jgi:hypothetical protein
MLFQKLLGVGGGNIKYVGGRTYGFLGTTSDVTISLSGTLSGGLDTSPSTGDLVIVYFGTGSTADRNLVVSGYTEVTELYADSTFDTNLVVAYRVYTFGSSLITFTGGSLSANDAGAVAIQVWRGVDAGTPFDVTETTATTTNSVLCNPPAITPTSRGAVIVSGGAGAHNDGTDTFSSSDLTDFLTVGQGDTNDVTIGLGYKVGVSGAFDPAQFTFSGTDSTSFSSASVTLALRSA